MLEEPVGSLSPACIRRYVLLGVCAGLVPISGGVDDDEKTTTVAGLTMAVAPHGSQGWSAVASCPASDTRAQAEAARIEDSLK